MTRDQSVLGPYKSRGIPSVLCQKCCFVHRHCQTYRGGGKSLETPTFVVYPEDFGSISCAVIVWETGYLFFEVFIISHEELVQLVPSIEFDEPAPATTIRHPQPEENLATLTSAYVGYSFALNQEREIIIDKGSVGHSHIFSPLPCVRSTKSFNNS